jgi:erythrin-vacuolar iron transport family protein
MPPTPFSRSNSPDHLTGHLKKQTGSSSNEEAPPDATASQQAAGAAGDDADRRFLLRVVQPGLSGLMDGSVSTLAPIFATAFATHHPFTAFLVGLASATGAGISMAFSEALSDTGEFTGRGKPVVRGSITGGMTFLGGSLHTLPFLVPNLHVALLVAYIVVAVELVVIAAIRHRYFGTSWWLSILQVVGGGALVFGAALIFGNA